MRPILFNTEMVRAILDGRKSVTRRVVKPQPISKICYICMGSGCGKWAYPSDSAMKYWGGEWKKEQQLPDAERARIWTPPYHAGDILYVRETWHYETFYEGATYEPEPDLPSGRRSWRYVYKADNPDYPTIPDRWHPSIHMPKEAARLFLRVTGVRVERLQDITEGGARAEGAAPLALSADLPGTPDSKRTWHEVGEARWSFCDLWNSTVKNADRTLYSWSANPWVWVIEFERISKEDAVEGGDGNV